MKKIFLGLSAICLLLTGCAQAYKRSEYVKNSDFIEKQELTSGDDSQVTTINESDDKSNSKKEAKSDDETSMFIVVEINDYFNVLYHKYTKVMYVDGGHSLTLLVDEDGKPLLYEE